MDDAGEEVDRNKIVDLENFNPEHRGIFTINHFIGDFRFLARASFYDDWTSSDFSGDPTYVDGGTSYNIDCTEDECYDGEWIFDVEAAYTLNEKYTFIAGAQNVFDQDAPDDAMNTTTGRPVQQLRPAVSPPRPPGASMAASGTSASGLISKQPSGNGTNKKGVSQETPFFRRLIADY